MAQTPKPTRTVAPKKWAMLGLAATGAAYALTPSGSATAPNTAPMMFAAYASEVGEAGEGAVQTDNKAVEFLVHLGFFEATHLIVSALYAEGHADLALEHLESSHHAHYGDIAEGVTKLGIDGFEPLAIAFADAVTTGASQADVAAKADAVFAAIAAVHASGAVLPKDEFQALHLLVQTAAEDYQAGVTDGMVDAPQEYRDAWGFATVAKTQADVLGRNPDATVAAAANKVVGYLEPVWAMFPTLTADKGGEDASVLFGAAGWVEMAALKVQ